MTTQTKIIAGVVGVVALVGAFVLILVLRSPSASKEAVTPIGFGIGDDRTVVIPAEGETEQNAPISSQGQQKIFKVADGPITSATIVQTFQPTTTIARYVLQENGHVMDLTLDTPGAVARAVSNTTIPGSVKAQWVEGGEGVVLQYFDSATTKTLYVGFPQATSATSSSPVRIQFLPDNIKDIAASPTGNQIAYLLSTFSGVDGYIAAANGAQSTKLFTLPLKDMLLSWPAESTLLAQMKSVANVLGVVFSVSASSGSTVPLLTASGLTATANPVFSHVLFQTIGFGQAPRTVARTLTTGEEQRLSFDPIPEKCIGSLVATTTLYCATPVQYVPPDYLELWHKGSASLPDAILAYNLSNGETTVLATPGSNEGGEGSDVVEMSISPDGRYLLFIKKGERSLWAVRLTQ